MRFDYTITYYPTGTVATACGEFKDEVDFFRYLNYWNRQGKGMYLYTTDCRLPAGCAALDIDSMHIIIPGIREPSKIYEEDGWWTSLTVITE